MPKADEGDVYGNSQPTSIMARYNRFMNSKHAIAALLLAQLMVGVAAAQDATSSEFGRVSGGQIDVLTKGARRFSGSLGVTFSGWDGARPGTGASLGGTILEDRIWFFSSVNQSESSRPGLTPREGSQPLETRSFDGKLQAQLGDRNSFTASFNAGRAPLPTIPALGLESFSSSFLSLRHTAIVSDHMFFTGSVTRRSGRLQ